MASIVYQSIDGSKKIVNGIPYQVKWYKPARLMMTFLPRALQPEPVAGRAGTSNPVSLSETETRLQRDLNWNYEQLNWLIKASAGWLYRIPQAEQDRLTEECIYPSLWCVLARVIDWSSAVALAGNFVLGTEKRGKWVRISGVPTDAVMTTENINPTRTPYWVHRVWVSNMFSDFHEAVRGFKTYSLVWDRNGRPNDYPDGSLWIDEEYLRPARTPSPWELSANSSHVSRTVAESQ